VSTQREILALLKDKAAVLPSLSGCYLMKNKDAEIIYVGKAKNLKARVTSYFNSSVKNTKTEILVSHIMDFDFFITDNETEALVLENNLIKEHTPKYNIRLRDDKTYPYVVIDYSEPFPRLSYERNPKRKKQAKIFGPFVVGSQISEVLKIMTKSFKLRDCSLREFNSRKNPCLLYQLDHCSAPCVKLITPADYEANLLMAQNFFEGRGLKSVAFLENKMQVHAELEEFERAAQLRDQINILKDFLEQSNQKNAEHFGVDQNFDVIAFVVGEIEVDISIYLTRHGLLVGKKSFHFSTYDVESMPEESVLSVLVQYYSSTRELRPEKIMLMLPNEMEEQLASVLKQLWQDKVVVQKVSTKFQSLYEITRAHAMEKQLVRSNNKDSVFLALDTLQEILELKERPSVIECYDVAIWQGSSPVASQVVFHQGKADPSKYRHYALEERVEGNNDFAMMREVLIRRLKHGSLPDLFVVDGGKGQVSVFLNVLKELDISIPVVGIAKAKNLKNKQTEERLIIPGRSNPYLLKKNRSLLKLMTSMRDEAHRFSRILHHKKEKKKLTTSWLDEINGIGPKTKMKILQNLKLTKEQVAKMDTEQIKKDFDISQKMAEKIFRYFS
jgi:excinuclease ABC subunit C